MNWIDKEIAKLVKKYKTTNPFDIAEKKNIHVLFHDLHPEILGYYKYERRNKFIVINKNTEENKQFFVCAHELGHSVCHPTIHTPFLRNSTFFSIDKVEREANYFATHLLLYDKNFQDYETTYDLLRSNYIPLEMERFLRGK